MAVARINIGKDGKPVPAKTSATPQRLASLDTLTPLPEKKKEIATDLSQYTFLIYGQPKIGKTTVLSTFPDALFLSTEPGAKGLSIFEYKSMVGGCSCWEDLLDAAYLITQTDRFKYVIIDTVDKAYEMCLDYVCRQMGIDYPGKDASGEADYGKSWKMVKAEFTRFIDCLARTRRGVAFTSHVKEEEIKTKFGLTYTRIYPSMSKQARSTVEALVDFFLYCDYVRVPEGVLRVFITEGDELIWAGHRQPAQFPRLVLMDPVNGYEMLERAFRGEVPELEIEGVTPALTSKRTLAEYLRNMKLAKKAKTMKGEVNE